MRWVSRAFFLGVFGGSAIVAACSSFEATDDDGASPEAGPSDTSMVETMAVDATPDADSGACEPDESDGGKLLLLVPARDAVLDPAREDAGARALCDLLTSTCVIAFDLKADAVRPIASVDLLLHRATGSDCVSPPDCTASQHRGGGTVLAAQMRTDWTQLATYQHPFPDGGWGGAGATGDADVAPSTVQDSPQPQDNAKLTFASAMLDPRFLPSATQPLIAFRVTPLATFPFVIRRVEYANSGAIDLASLTVHFCKP